MTLSPEEEKLALDYANYILNSDKKEEMENGSMEKISK